MMFFVYAFSEIFYRMEADTDIHLSLVINFVSCFDVDF